MFWRFPGCGHGLSSGCGSSREASQAFNERHVPILVKGRDHQNTWEGLQLHNPAVCRPSRLMLNQAAGKGGVRRGPAKLVNTDSIDFRGQLTCGAGGRKDGLLGRRNPGQLASGHVASAEHGSRGEQVHWELDGCIQPFSASFLFSRWQDVQQALTRQMFEDR